MKFELDCTLILSYRSTKAKMCFLISYYYWLVSQFSLRSWVTTSLTQLMWVHVPTQFSLRSWVTTSLTQLMWVHVPTQFSLRSWVTTSLTQLMWIHVPTISSNLKFPSHLPKQDSTIMFACLSCTNWKIGQTNHIGWSFVWGDKWLKLLIMNKIMNICWSLNHEMCG